MMDTKRAIGKLDGRQCYHIIQSFKPGEVSPELAPEIAKEFAAEYLPDYEAVIGTHIDKKHIHFMIMEHIGWEISHGNRLGFRLRDKNTLCAPGGRIRYSPNRASKPLSKETWRLLRLGSSLP